MLLATAVEPVLAQTEPGGDVAARQEQPAQSPGTAVEYDRTNLIPNYDHIAGEAGFTLWYRDRTGLPLGRKGSVLTIAEQSLTVDWAPAAPLADGGVLLVELVPEDMEPGREYVFKFRARCDQPFGLPVTVPGTIVGPQRSPDKPAVQVVGPIPVWKQPQTVRFRYEPPAEGKTPQISLFIRPAKRPVTFTEWQLRPADETK